MKLTYARIASMMTEAYTADEPNTSPLAVSSIRSIPLPIGDLIETERRVWRVDGVQWRTATGFTRHFVVSTENGSDLTVAEHTTAITADIEAAKVAAGKA